MAESTGLDVGANLKTLQNQQGVLQKAFMKNKAAFYEAQEILNASKMKLSKFDDKYGRLLQLLGE